MPYYKGVLDELDTPATQAALRRTAAGVPDCRKRQNSPNLHTAGFGQYAEQLLAAVVERKVDNTVRANLTTRKFSAAPKPDCFVISNS